MTDPNGTMIIANKELLDAILENREQFDAFLKDHWEPHVQAIRQNIGYLNRLPEIANSIESMAKVIRIVGKGLLALLALLILINGAGQILQQVRDSNTSFKGTIGGQNGAQIEIKREKEVEP